MALMGGRYDNDPGPEHNFGFHCTADEARCNGISSAPIAPSTKFVVEHWPETVPLVYLGFEVGNRINTGGAMTNSTPDSNPCRAAYIDRQGPGNDRKSWDPATTLFAVRG